MKLLYVTTILTLATVTLPAQAYTTPTLECVRPVYGEAGNILYCTRDLSRDWSDLECSCNQIPKIPESSKQPKLLPPKDDVPVTPRPEPEPPEEPEEPPVDPKEPSCEDDDDTKPGWGHGDENHDHAGPPGLDKPKTPKTPKP